MSLIDPDSYSEPWTSDASYQGGSEEFSDTDLETLLQQLNGTQPTEEEMQEQFDKNFQTKSYLFMKDVYAFAEEKTQY